MSYLITIEESIATFTINRPERRNAVNTAVMDGLEEFIEQVKSDAAIHFAVITGAGNEAFCSGGDLSEFHKLRTAQETFPMLSRMADLLYKLSTLPIPVIALVNGVAVGGGCEIAMACDYRLISSKAKAGFIQGTLAITTGWGGATLLFEKDGKHDRVLRLLSEAEIHSAEKLLEEKWATEIYEGDAKAGLLHFLSKMSQIHHTVHKAYKTIAIRKWTADFMRDRMIEEARQCSVLWENEAHHAAVDNFLTKK
ncbi:enoyl-CoA hydratase/isomerase family protein [Sporosarcina sp. G11-34]|uniref:enoyl-CoA hydratase/isomerase family protein n=1 Tax=Sporosarcina sp. G11-34 TaxID=2849605 RepID=UPI0022A90ACE|nr:enoyl-CoA hydratase/isomerase family protein [Sporosarcina sp. G11-34]MCZ2258885.1 enoyl-CoA hydratase/isomerase family protein [Sporosarcina sp. G11-34]